MKVDRRAIDGGEVVYGMQRAMKEGPECERMVHAKLILTKLDPDTSLQFSKGWFLGIKNPRGVDES